MRLEEAIKGSAGSVAGHLNAGCVQRGLVALAFGGLQVWGIGSSLKTPDQARALSDGEIRKTLEQIWAKRTCLL